MISHMDIAHGGLNSRILLLCAGEGHRGKGIGRALLNEAVKNDVERMVVEKHVDTVFEDAEVLQEARFKDGGVMLELFKQSSKVEKALQYYSLLSTIIFVAIAAITPRAAIHGVKIGLSLQR